MVHLITGYAGAEHIKSADQGSFNAAFFGSGQYVMEIGSRFEGSVINNNTVRILDGDLLMYGRHIRIEPDTYEDILIETGTAGTNRIDLICMTYEKNALDGTEISYLEVVKGEETPGTALVPSYIVGNILNGESKNQMPLYQVQIKGVALSSITSLFTTIPTYKKLAEEYAEKFKKDCESHLNSLGVLDTMEEIEANTQANQVAGALALKEGYTGVMDTIGVLHKDKWVSENYDSIIYGVGEPDSAKYPPETYFSDEYEYVDVNNGNVYQVVENLATSGGYVDTVYEWEKKDTLTTRAYNKMVNSGIESTSDPNTTKMAVIRTKHDNCPTNDMIYIIITLFTDTLNENGERVQIGIPAGLSASKMYVRGKAFGIDTWGNWSAIG